MNAAIVQRPRPTLPAINLLLAGAALVVSAIAVADHAGSSTTIQTKPSVTVSVPHTSAHTCVRKVHPTC